MNYLKNKHRGGINAEKGSKYEAFYVVFKVADYLSSVLSMPQILFQSQIEDAYVDDLLITNKHSNELIYHQLKNVRDLTWTDVEDDFVNQKHQSDEAGENYKLALVFSNIQFKKEDIPSSFNACLKSIYFPYDSSRPSIYATIESFPSFKEALRKLSKLPCPTDDKIYALAECFLGHWFGSDAQTGVYLHSFREQIVLHSSISTIFDDDITISESCRQILDAIEGFSYFVKGNSIIWESDRFKDNTTNWSKDWEDRIISNNPKSVNDIVKLM